MPPQTAQMFSHFHTLAYLVGVAKLPLIIPAMIERIIPMVKLDMNEPPTLCLRRYIRFRAGSAPINPRVAVHREEG